MSWAQNLQSYIFDTITPLVILKSSNISDEWTPKELELRRDLVNESAMRIWILVFTHRSYNPNEEENLEPREFVGDALMGKIFSAALTATNPDITAESLTNLKNEKVWKKEQAKIADELGLAKDGRLHTSIPISIDDKEDLLEAAFGGLYAIGEKVVGEGNGDMLCRNFMIRIYDLGNLKFDPVKLRPEANQLKEIGDKLKWWAGETGSVKELGIAVPVKNAQGKTTGFTVTFTLPEKAQRWLTRNGKPIMNGGVIARQSAPQKSDANTAAIKEGLLNLKRYYGLDWAEAARLSKLVSDRDDILSKRMRTDKVIEIELERFDPKRRGAEYLQLIGVKEGGKRVILLTVVKDPSLGRINEKKAIVDLYRNNGSRPPGEIVRLVAQ